MSEHADTIRVALRWASARCITGTEDYARQRDALAALAALEADLAEARRERDEARKLARNLFNMIDRETWRTTGGDDGQGHYDGDGYAERVNVKIRSWPRERRCLRCGYDVSGYGPISVCPKCGLCPLAVASDPRTRIGSEGDTA